MESIVIQKMESEDVINGKGYVHYQSWHETYPGLVDPGYLARHTLEKCVAIAHKWPDNILVAKDGEKVIGFVGYGPYRDDTLPACGEVFALYVLAEYHGQKGRVRADESGHRKAVRIPKGCPLGAARKREGHPLL